MLRNVAMTRSHSNSPSGRRYNQTYTVLVNAWSQLAKVDKATRHAIWLYENSELVLPWLATLPQSQHDRWTHPQTIRRYYEKRHPSTLPDKEPIHRPRQPRHRREWNRQPLGERTREDLEMMIGGLGGQLADRDREIVEKDELLAEKDREIARLRDDLAWEQTARKQLEGVTMPLANATVVRPDGETAEIVHAVCASQEIVPREAYGQPDYLLWAKTVVSCIGELSVVELQWLLTDNAAHLDAYETAFPGAGVALEDGINARIAELVEPSVDHDTA